MLYQNVIVFFYALRVVQTTLCVDGWIPAPKRVNCNMKGAKMQV